MAISDRELSLEQKKLAERYGSEILALNNADQTFLINLKSSMNRQGPTIPN